MYYELMITNDSIYLQWFCAWHWFMVNYTFMITNDFTNLFKYFVEQKNEATERTKGGTYLYFIYMYLFIPQLGFA